LFYYSGLLKNGALPDLDIYYINGKKGSGIQTNNEVTYGKLFGDDGSVLTESSGLNLNMYSPQELSLKKFTRLHLMGSEYYETVSDGIITLIYYNGVLYLNDKTQKITYSGLFDGLFYLNGIKGSISSTNIDYKKYNLTQNYTSGYPTTLTANDYKDAVSSTKPYIYLKKLWIGNSQSSRYRLFNNIDAIPRYNGNGLLYYNGMPYTGIWRSTDFYNGVYGNDKAYFSGRLFTGILSSPSMTSFYYINGVKLIGSDAGITYNNYFYKYGYKVISTGYYNGEYYLNGVKQ